MRHIVLSNIDRKFTDREYVSATLRSSTVAMAYKGLWSHSRLRRCASSFCCGSSHRKPSEAKEKAYESANELATVPRKAGVSAM